MFRSPNTARRACVVLLLLVIATLCVPTSQASAAPLAATGTSWTMAR